ncbi:hypothetical protein EVAR_37561_1 [Eumeta japonica]|uniref:Uncharacterized protein n=1 Tax=Eumeta variegata TaxID=151549 RepID=A0A4C1XV51_EUMVA|nr:hypothetical protein EVAR_37561_1 [Eumeta japonica]
MYEQIRKELIPLSFLLVILEGKLRSERAVKEHSLSPLAECNDKLVDSARAPARNAGDARPKAYGKIVEGMIITCFTVNGYIVTDPHLKERSTKVIPKVYHNAPVALIPTTGGVMIAHSASEQVPNIARPCSVQCHASRQYRRAQHKPAESPHAFVWNMRPRRSLLRYRNRTQQYGANYYRRQHGRESCGDTPARGRGGRRRQSNAIGRAQPRRDANLAVKGAGVLAELANAINKLLFKNSYEATTLTYEYKPHDNLIRLRVAVQGKARRAMCHLPVANSKLKNIMAVLERKFGEPEQLVDELLKELIVMSRLMDNDKK